MAPSLEMIEAARQAAALWTHWNRGGTDGYRILVTGSRGWSDHDLVRDALAAAVYQNTPAVIVHGACPSGADAIASWWVRSLGRNLNIVEEPHRAEVRMAPLGARTSPNRQGSTPPGSDPHGSR